MTTIVVPADHGLFRQPCDCDNDAELIDLDCASVRPARDIVVSDEPIDAGLSNSAASDVRVSWPTCTRWEATS